MIYTIIAGAKQHRIERWAYLNDAILQPTVDAAPEPLERLLTDRWAVAPPELVLNHRLAEVAVGNALAGVPSRRSVRALSSIRLVTS